jgi:hypothetical protein
MEQNPMVFLAGSAPLYSALGSVYGYGPAGSVEVVERPDQPVKFDDRLWGGGQAAVASSVLSGTQRTWSMPTVTTR